MTKFDKGIAPMRLDHALLYGPHVDQVLEIFTKVLGFHLAEFVTLPNSDVKGALWLCCSNKAHDIAFVIHPEPGKLHHVSFCMESWERVLRVNLTGTFHCLQAAIPDMLDAGWGRIVMISSSSAQQGAPRMGHYSASKGGVIALTRSLAKEFGRRGITVNNVPPSSIDTPMSRHSHAVGDLPDLEVLAQRSPVGRMGTADDIAAAVAFLASEDAGYVTGQTFGVNGGAVA
jgi:NAD(P)-dependent dehydrogenase (short-subunit alcohol dehydrogenase family)